MAKHIFREWVFLNIENVCFLSDLSESINLFFAKQKYLYLIYIFIYILKMMQSQSILNSHTSIALLVISVSV